MAAVSKEEYLKKYLSGNDEQNKKKKRRRKVKTDKVAPRLKIVDDDVDFHSLLPENLHNTLEEDVGDDDPTVAEVVDERPEEIKTLEKYRKDRRWRTLGQDPERQTNRNQHDSDSDNSDFNQSRLRRQRHDSNSDESPPRRQRHDSDSDQSLPRKHRHDSDSDQSPPRKKRGMSDSDQSPPRRKRGGSDSDQSPPRRKRGVSDSDQSPPRRKKRVSDSDQSPPRRKRHDSGSDQSPPRRKRDLKPHSRRKQHDSDSDQSPPRKRRDTQKFSPSRKIKSEPLDDTQTTSKQTSTRKRKSRFDPAPAPSLESISRDSKERSVSSEAKDDKGRAVKTLSGATAGLSSAKQMRNEAKIMKQREDEMFDQLDDSVLGKNAKTVFRERNKKTREEKDQEEKDEAKKAQMEEKYKSWNKGLKQSQYQQEAVEAALNEMSKPLTRLQGDSDLESHLKAQDREGDPMLAFIKKKQKKDPKKKELPRYKGPQPPMNRFNIWPGYRWDGVDRSNGFERAIVAKKAEKKAVKEIAYKWSVEDM